MSVEIDAIHKSELYLSDSGEILSFMQKTSNGLAFYELFLNKTTLKSYKKLFPQEHGLKRIRVRLDEVIQSLTEIKSPEHQERKKFYQAELTKAEAAYAEQVEKGQKAKEKLKAGRKKETDAKQPEDTVVKTN